MPIYEYWCYHCRHKLALYLPRFSPSPPSCPDCGNNTLTRLFSTFSVHKTDKDIYENILSDSQLVDRMMHNDPKALADWNKRMSRGEKTAPEYEEMLGKIEKGELPAELTGKGKKNTPEED